ncbi:MAG: transketolase C-terminal domain-containing protein [Candidatus Magasanikbacteria bacterium]
MENKPTFPIDLSQYRSVELDTEQEKLTDDQKRQLKQNIQLVKDTIVFFTGYAGAKGMGGHTGGAYDIAPEVLIVDGFIKGSSDVYPVLFDEAGHRVAIQYLMAVLNGDLPEEKLLKYREHAEEDPLPGHPEMENTDGVKFSSGRLGHLGNFVNGVAKANPDQSIVLFTSDGSQQEGNCAEAVRFAVANDLNVKLIADDNNVTIAGHPEQYMKGYDIAETWRGHGLDVDESDDPDNIDQLYSRIRGALIQDGPVGLVNKRPIAEGIEGEEGEPRMHDVIEPEPAVNYLSKKGYSQAVTMIENAENPEEDKEYLGSNDEWEKNRYKFGEIINDIISGMDEQTRKDKVFVVDCDLQGSTGIDSIEDKYPEIFIKGGVMERNNYSTAAGFGFDGDRQGIFATFSAFSEMVNSEIKMARLNESNVLAHFSHAGVDWMADNTCHFGDNIFFTDNALKEQKNTRLYFPADLGQMEAVLHEIFDDRGLRFVFSTRSPVPQILDENGEKYYGDDYDFEPDKDEIIRKGSDGYIISFGAMLYRALNAVEKLNEEGIDVGLINKPTLNVVDEGMMNKLKDEDNILVVEDQNQKTGLGIRFGTWLLQYGFTGEYDHIGTTRLGHGGVKMQVPHQGLGSGNIQEKMQELIDS